MSKQTALSMVLVLSAVTIIAIIFTWLSTSKNQPVVEKLAEWVGLVKVPDENVPITKIEMRNISLAISLYFDEFNEYPHGNHAAIMRALTGKNPGKTVFIEPDLNEKHEFIDPWGTPYDIHISPSGELKIISAGPNGIFGDENDDVLEKKLQ